MIKNYLSHFLPVLLALDLIIPFLLAPFYKDYNHLTQVMSVLGNSKAPLHSIYNIWLVAFGVAILISTLQLYPTVAQVSSSISIMLFSVIVIYAVGGCILSGIFSVGETKSLETLSAKIHGYLLFRVTLLNTPFGEKKRGPEGFTDFGKALRASYLFSVLA